jgi:signal recognition particle subunit SRP54
MRGDFTLDDFRKQLEAIAKVGQKDMIRRMPGMSEMVPEGEDPAVATRRITAMIDAMTPEERRDPDRIDGPARERIATKAGCRPEDVEQFLAQFAQVRELMRQMAGTSLWQRIQMVVGLGGPPKPGDS